MSEKKGYSQIRFWLTALVAFCLLAGQTQPVAASSPTVPKAPSNLTGKYYPLGIAALVWKDNSSDETGFKFNLDFKCPVSGAKVTTWVSGGVGYSIKANTTSVNLQMQNGCTYTITVQAVGKNNVLSAKSNVVTLVAPPVPPSSLTVTKGNNYTAKWKDNSNNEGIFVVAIGSAKGVTVFGYDKNTTSAAIPASAIPASAKYEWMVGAIPASAIPASFKSGQAIPASILKNLAIPSNSNAKYLIQSSYLPLMLGSNLVSTK